MAEEKERVKNSVKNKSNYLNLYPLLAAAVPPSLCDIVHSNQRSI